MSDHRPNARSESAGAEHRKSGRGHGEDSRNPQNIFLRTVYPLNPGIPHYLDFPVERA